MKLLRVLAVLLLLTPLTGCRSPMDMVLEGASNAVANDVKARLGTSLISIRQRGGFPYRGVTVSVDWKRQLTQITSAPSGEGKTKEEERTLTEAEFGELRQALARVDWQRVTQNQVRGKDEPLLRIEGIGDPVSLWDSEFVSRKRDLRKVQKLKTTLFRLASLDATGRTPNTALNQDKFLLNLSLPAAR
jgi:hypothetical protein